MTKLICTEALRIINKDARCLVAHHVNARSILYFTILHDYICMYLYMDNERARRLTRREWAVRMCERERNGKRKDER